MNACGDAQSTERETRKKPDPRERTCRWKQEESIQSSDMQKTHENDISPHYDDGRLGPFFLFIRMIKHVLLCLPFWMPFWRFYFHVRHDDHDLMRRRKERRRFGKAEINQVRAAQRKQLPVMRHTVENARNTAR